MLVKYCNQIVRAVPFSKTAATEKRVVPLDNQRYRYLRFRAIGNLEIPGFNGNWDGFPYEEFENERPGFGYTSFRNKRAHLEHNSALGESGHIGDLPDAYLNKFIYPEDVPSKKWASLAGTKNAGKRAQILSMAKQTDGSIEVLMRLDTSLIDNPSINRDVRRGLADIIRSVDAGQQLTCSMGTNCFIPGTQIEIPDGTYKLIENVRRGDFVISHKGKSCNVIDTFVKHYEGDLLKISVTGQQRPLQVTPEHPILIKKKYSLCACGCGSRVKYPKKMWIVGHHNRIFNANAKPKKTKEEIDALETQLRNKYSEQFEWIDARDVELSDLVAYPISNEIIEAPQITEGKAKLIGYFLAEGSFIKYTPVDGDAYKTGVTFSFGAGDKDKDFIIEVQELLKKEFGVSSNTYNAIEYGDNKEKEKKYGVHRRIGSTEIRASSKEVAKFFEYYCGEYTEHKHMPMETMQWPRNLQALIIAGYFNGDGCQYTNQNGYKEMNAVSVSETLAYQMAFLLRKNRIACSLERRHYEYQQHPTYTLHIRGHWQNVLHGVWSYEKSGLSFHDEGSSSSSFSISDNYILMPINKIEHEYYKGPVYNFEVEDDNSYIANGISVHNCTSSICSVCGNEAQFAADYCDHLKRRKGALHVVTANEIRNLLDKDILRPEWLPHIIASSFDVAEVLKGMTNKGIAVYAGEINKGLSFFELSVVKMPAYTDAIALENLAKQASLHNFDFLSAARKQLGDENIINLYNMINAESPVSLIEVN